MSGSEVVVVVVLVVKGMALSIVVIGLPVINRVVLSIELVVVAAVAFVVGSSCSRSLWSSTTCPPTELMFFTS